MCDVIRVSPLGKTWLLDIDGTVCKHNGYKIDGKDTLLPGAKAFFENLPAEDRVIFLTSRTQEQAGFTEAFLRDNGIRYDAILYGLPYGERILINDRKPSGLCTSLAVNTQRDEFCTVRFEIDENL